MRYSTPCSRVSSVSARKRLPIPASANSSVICSGVSIVILSSSTPVISTSWIEKRKQYWERLEQLLEQTQHRGIRSLDRGELRELGLLYRQAASDLAVLRADTSSVHFARYLNQLLARAHNTIYSGKKTSAVSILHFFRDTYPEVFRRNLPYCLLAFVLFLGGALVGSVLTLQDPDFQLKIIGPQMVETIRTTRDVDPFHGRHQAAGLQRDHDQQPERRLHHVRRRHHRRPGHDLHDRVQRAADWRDRDGLLTCRE